MAQGAHESEALITANLDLAERAAALIHPRVARFVERNELVAMGRAGLVDAAKRFDASKGVKFSTFAWYRVQGAIIDGIRTATNLPRIIWTQLTALERAAAYLEQRGQAPQPDGSTVETLSDIKRTISGIRMVHTVTLESVHERELRATNVPTPEIELLATEAQRELRRAVAGLPAREAELMTYHYFHGMSLTEAGAAMGLSKSWASRLHAQAIDRLRERVRR